MARPVRRPHPSLIEHLFAQPRAFTLMQAIRIIERAAVRAARGDGRDPPDPVGRGTNAQRVAVTIGASVPLAFAADEITALARPEQGAPVLTQTLIGLTGATGVLPHVFSDMVQGSIREREHGLRAFLDLFNTRVAQLFYGAWAKHRLFIECERSALPGERSPIDALLAAIVGLGQQSLRHRMSVPDATPIHFSGLLGRHARSAQAADQILTGALGYPIKIEQFHGTWLSIAPADRTRLGTKERPEATFCRLGSETVAGARIWDVQASVCIVVGPLGYRDFLAFLPDGVMSRYLIDLATFTLGPEISVHSRILLKPDEVPALCLGADPRATPAGRLGRNTWLGWSGKRVQRGEVNFQPASPLR